MLPVITLMAAAAAATAPDTPICAGIENPIAEHLRIAESDLTRDAAREAARNLTELVAAETVAWEADMQVLNASKVILGYVLRRRAVDARADADPARTEPTDRGRVFCDWLTTQGFWYD
jgi:hypothetical protein